LIRENGLQDSGIWRIRADSLEQTVDSEEANNRAASHRLRGI
jgi:hypothetical protein